MLRDVFGFTEHQEKATIGLGYKWKLTRTQDNAVLNRTAATTNIKIVINTVD